MISGPQCYRVAVVHRGPQQMSTDWFLPDWFEGPTAKFKKMFVNCFPRCLTRVLCSSSQQTPPDRTLHWLPDWDPIFVFTYFPPHFPLVARLEWLLPAEYSATILFCDNKRKYLNSLTITIFLDIAKWEAHFFLRIYYFSGVLSSIPLRIK